MAGLAQLRHDITTHSTNTPPTTNDIADDTSNLMNNAAAATTSDKETKPSIRPQQLAAYESALGLLSCQLEQLVAGAAAVKGALAAAGLLPGDGGTARYGTLCSRPQQPASWLTGPARARLMQRSWRAQRWRVHR
jgi:hypothetical protein